MRNLLLDWVSAVLGEAGPEAVARMIKLEVKQAQVPGAAIMPARAVARALPFAVLIVPPNGALVLAQDPDWTGAAEKENGLGPRLAEGAPFSLAGRQVFVLGTTAYPGGRVLYQCVSIQAAP